MEGELGASILTYFVAQLSFVIPTSIPIASILLLAPPAGPDDTHCKRMQVSITPSMDPPLLMSLPDIPPFLQPISMPHTKVASFMVASNFSSTFASSVSIQNPPLKCKLEMTSPRVEVKRKVHLLQKLVLSWPTLSL